MPDRAARRRKARSPTTRRWIFPFAEADGQDVREQSGIKAPVERTGAERLFNRIGQETAPTSSTLDVVNSSDAAHFIIWKRNGWLAPYLPDDIAENYDGRPRSGRHLRHPHPVSPIAYNTSLVKPEDAPKSFMDLLDPKYAGKLVKGHPGYSGTIMTATHQIARDLGWEYFEKLAKQKVLQVQSATEPPKKIQPGERAVMVDGADYLVIRYKENGSPIEIVHPDEGTPLATVRPWCSSPRPIRTPRACSRTGCTRAKRSSSWSTGRASIQRTGRRRKSPASGNCGTSS